MKESGSGVFLLTALPFPIGNSCFDRFRIPASYNVCVTRRKILLIT